MKKRTINEEINRMKDMMGKLMNENLYGAAGWEGIRGDIDYSYKSPKVNKISKLIYNEEFGNMESFERLKNIVDSNIGFKITDVEMVYANFKELKSRGYCVIRFHKTDAIIECSFSFDGFYIELTDARFVDGDEEIDGTVDYEYEIKDQPSLNYIEKFIDLYEIKDKIIEKLQDMSDEIGITRTDYETDLDL